MKHTCPKLGIIWYSSSGYGVSSCEHPVLSTPLKTLIKYTVDPAVENKDKILIAAGLLNYLPVIWHTPLDWSDASHFLLLEFSSIATLAAKLDIVDRIHVPKLVINKQTNSLANLANWILTLNEALSEEAQKQDRYRLEARLARKEAVIARLLNSQIKRNRNKLAIYIADWAAEAAAFPTSLTYTDIGTPIRLSEYWKQIIVSSFQDNHLDILASGTDYDDLCDLVEYLEFNIPHGSTHAAVLMAEIRKTKGILEEFTARKVTIIEPKLPEPKRQHYPDTASYLRAKLAYVNSKTDIQPLNDKLDTRTDTYLDL